MADKVYKNNYEGKCSACMSENVDYGALEVDDAYIYYPITCNDCGAVGKEWFYLKYEETEMSRKDKNEIPKTGST